MTGALEGPDQQWVLTAHPPGSLSKTDLLTASNAHVEFSPLRTSTEVGVSIAIGRPSL